MTVDEKVSKYGKKIVENYMIIDHDSRDEKKLVNLGTTKHGTKIHVSRLAFESELLISLGVVEPHQFAGYSGGFKTMAIGAAGDTTISQTHSLNMLTNPKTGLTRLEGNPVYEDIIEIGKKTGLKFVVNVVAGKEQQILEIKSGEPQETQNVLIKFSQEINEIPINKSYDVAICGVGFPKDTNLYQVSRAASYLFFASIKVIKEGGYIIIPARCEEGAGQGVGEQRFFSMLKNKSLKGIINSTSEFKAGEQRAFFMANVLSHYKVIIVDSLVPEIIREAKMIPAKNMDEAFEMVKNDLGSNLDLILIPKSLSTLPIIRK
jgi:nickel-dependent lactate racemase